MPFNNQSVNFYLVSFAAKCISNEEKINGAPIIHETKDVIIRDKVSTWFYYESSDYQE